MDASRKRHTPPTNREVAADAAGMIIDALPLLAVYVALPIWAAYELVRWLFY